MSFSVACGDRSLIDGEIASGRIPVNTLIISGTHEDSELFFYDEKQNLYHIASRNKFASIDEAKSWILKYDCQGSIIAIYNNEEWHPYIVSKDGEIIPIAGGSFEPTIDRITLGGVEAPVVDKTVDIPMATKISLGLVKSSNDENCVTVDENGIMYVDRLNVNKLVQTDGESIVLDGDLL